MVNISNSNLPGVYAVQESISSVNANTTAPADVGIVGEADLSTGSASADTVYRVTNAPQAVRLFGDSPLASNVSDALQNGAYPVYAVAPSATAVTDEDVYSASITSGTLANERVTEDTAKVVFTADGTDLTTVLSMNPGGETLEADEVAYNPNSGDFELGASPSTTLVVDYEYFDYSGGIDAIVAEEGDRIDFLGVTSENTTVVDALHTAVTTAAQSYQFMLAVGGASDGYIADTSAYTNPFDSSRIQLLYASRNQNHESLIGAYLGMRGRIGIDRSGMRKKLEGQTGLSSAQALTTSDKENLDGENIVVIEYAARSVRPMTDHTCVTASNTDEIAYNHGLARLVGDYVTLLVHDTADPFIGLLHTPGARANLKAQVAQQMKALLALNAVVRYTVDVEEIDSVTARVTVGMELAKPLRNIEAVIVGGDVSA
jgi:hypothetical protein